MNSRLLGELIAAEEKLRTLRPYLKVNRRPIHELLKEAIDEIKRLSSGPPLMVDGWLSHRDAMNHQDATRR